MKSFAFGGWALALLASACASGGGSSTASIDDWGRPDGVQDAKVATANTDSDGTVAGDRAAAPGPVDASAASAEEIADGLVRVSRPVRGGTLPVAGVVLNTAFVQFALGSANIDSGFEENLHVIGAALEDNRLVGGCLTIAGHTDTTGSTMINDTLSEARAKAVMQKISELNYKPKAQLKLEGYGSSKLADPLRPEAAENRRVTFEHCVE